jgi:hypothetical protein
MTNAWSQFALDVRRGLDLIGFGLLLAFVGLVFLANLFGVADENSRSIARGRWNRWFLSVQKPNEVKNSAGYKIGRYSVGVGWVLVGLFAVAGGIAYVLAPFSE